MSLRTRREKAPRNNRRSFDKPLSLRRRWFFRFLLLLLPVALLGLLEIWLRLGGYGFDTHLFKRLKIGTQDYFVQNEDFGRRFFPRGLERHPGPVRFPVHKAPGTFRIFVMGESAAMGDPDQSFAPDRYLAILLQEKYPATRFEVINVAFTAINSHVIVPMARECAVHEGDLWLVYMGNNEMVGPFGAATVFGPQAPSLSYVRLVLTLQRSRVVQWVMEKGHKFRGEKDRAAWGGMGMFLNNLVAPDSPARERVYRNLRKNLDDIVRAGIGSGAKVLLNTVAVNLKDCPPFASGTNTQLSLADRGRCDQFYTNGLQAAEQREWAKATELFEQAGHLDMKSAELQYQWAQALLAQTNLEASRSHFQLACDYDALPFRADSRVNTEIRAERQRITGENLILFDAAAGLAVDGTGTCGRETFFEHVHFDFDGRYRLGRAWAEQIAAMLPRNTNSWVSQEACEKLLGLSPWNRAQVIHLMDERMQMPPLSSQPNNSGRRSALAERINRLRAQWNPENAATTRQNFSKLLEQRAEDYFLRQEYAVFLELSGDVALAASEWRRYCELMPHDSLGYYLAGRMLSAQQQYAEAEASLRIATTMRPSRTDAWVELGNALLFQKKYADALACYSTAQTQDSRNAQLLIYRGKALSGLNRHSEARDSYRAALRLEPANSLAHHELAVELTLTGEPEIAGAELAEAARLSPDNVVARLDYGLWLMQRRRWDTAQQEFEAVLRLDPGNVPAQQNLAFLHGTRR